MKTRQLRFYFESNECRKAKDRQNVLMRKIHRKMRFLPAETAFTSQVYYQPLKQTHPELAHNLRNKNQKPTFSTKPQQMSIKISNVNKTTK